MILKVDHIGVAVKDLSNSNKLFAALLGRDNYKIEEVTSESVTTSFFNVNDTKIELLAAISDQGPISKFIEKKGEGIHHIAFEVEDIYEAIEELKAEGFTFINEEPKQGADNKLICFVHPKTSNGVLVELCQTIK
ncbi:MAG TPA: methylmalonyl-CoA epimerase [Cytophagales bacterium]|nr:methylmalonyl-CoA epimerase [Cytophagales bacterium]